jgi:hypothetical protein
MRRSVIAVLGGAALAAAEGDPAGTVMLQIEVGQSAPVSGAPGANLLCDDPAVVASDFGDDAGGFVLRALTPGTTLCGMWLAGQKPGGLYRVTVTAKADAAAPAQRGDAGPAAATDGGPEAPPGPPD